MLLFYGRVTCPKFTLTGHIQSYPREALLTSQGVLQRVRFFNQSALSCLRPSEDLGWGTLGRGGRMCLVWISKPTVSCIEKKPCPIHYFAIVFALSQSHLMCRVFPHSSVSCCCFKAMLLFCLPSLPTPPQHLSHFSLPEKGGMSPLS